MKRATHGRSAASSLAIGVMAILAWAVPAQAAGPASGYTGRWTAIDCATWWEEPHVVDCSVWGDGSVQTLTIGPGSRPVATYQDAFASVCANEGFPSTRFVASGTGAFDGAHLWVTYTRIGCGAALRGGEVVVDYYHDAGSDTIWEDPDGDGWGLNWVRA